MLNFRDTIKLSFLSSTENFELNIIILTNK